LYFIDECFAAASWLDSLNLCDLVGGAVLTNVEVDWRVLEVAQLGDLVVDVRSHELYVIPKTVLFQFT